MKVLSAALPGLSLPGLSEEGGSGRFMLSTYEARRRGGEEVSVDAGVRVVLVFVHLTWSGR